MGKKNRLICHILDEKKRELGSAKGNVYDGEIKWKKRQWNIAEASKQDVFITDKKGITHCYVNVNDADGSIHFLTPKQLNLYDSNNQPIDKCGECGGRISIDAEEHRIVNRKNIIKSFWGLDNSYMLLILLLGIVCVILVGALFFVVGELNKTNNLLQKYLVPAPVTASSANFVLGAIINVY